MDALLEFLFKYRPVVFRNGDLALAAPWPILVMVGIGLLLIIPPLLSYTRVRGRLGTIDRAVLAFLRITALAVLVFCLLRPTLIVSTVIPQQNFLGILIDDSRSMQIDDGVPRAEFIREKFGPEGSDLLDALAERFKLRLFGFSESAERIASSADLTFTGARTRLGSALDRVQGELSTVPLAGLVVFTDGADNADVPLTESILQLRGRGIPVHTVGVGREHFDKDIEITRVESPRTVLKGTTVAVDVMVIQSGYAGKTVRLNVEDAGRIVSSQDVELPRDGEVSTVRTSFQVTEAGPRHFRFHIVPEPGELVTENNVREALVEVRDRTEKILYFEGEPRFEVKFLRRAIEGDDNLRVVTLERLAENMFKRLDVENEDELAGGFPKTREELFRYKGLILGSVEASFFTHDQLQMIAEFVGQRGGGLLALGGRYSFAEGGYAGTPVANVLPVVLEPESEGGSPFFSEVKVELTPFGSSHPVTQIAPTPQESAERWRELPSLTTLNRIVEVKPGASTLLLGDADLPDKLIVLASQRYGKGRAVAFPVQDSWMWQMNADIPLDDMTHETFWRQLLRWLISAVPDQVTATVSKDRVGLEEPITVTAEVADSAYLKVNDATAVARVVTPSGLEQELSMGWIVERDGEYQASFEPAEEGLYEIQVEVSRNGESYDTVTTYVEASGPVDEYFGAQMRASLLQRLASETGGQFYTPSTVEKLPEDVRYTESGSTVYEEKDLWDMPIVFFLLIGLVATEWGYRRARGMV